MMRINALFVIITGFVLGMVGISPVMSAGTYYVVQSGDTLSTIAKKYQGVSWKQICQDNNLTNCDRIKVGQKLSIGYADVRGKKVPAKHQVAERSDFVSLVKTSSTTSSETVRSWKRVGADPLLPVRMRKEWHRADELRLTSAQSDRLAQFGLSSSEIEQVRSDLVSGKCNATARPVGYTWKGMAMGKGNWSQTQNATGDFIMVWACPSHNGKQVDIAMKCGNVAWNESTISTPPPPPKTEEALACEAVGSVWAQMGGRGESGSIRFSCLFPVGNGWKVGPSIGVKGSRYSNDSWVEVGNFYGAGIEGRGSIGNVDAVEFVVLVGQGSTRGYSKDGMVEKMKATGLDAKIAIQLRERFQISEKTGVTVRFMPWVDVPLTGNSAKLLWQGNQVGEEKGRKLVVGAILRLEVDQVDWNVKPEFTLGIWNISDVQDPVGGKILAGIATKDDVFRIGVGVQFPDPHFIVEVEWNAGLGWLRANSQVAETSLVKNAGSSEAYLGVKAKAVAPKAEKAPTIIAQKQESKSSSSSSSPFDWAGDAQTSSRSSGGGEKLASASSSGGFDTAFGLFGGS
ncbi:MAG: LysM domain-containing protein [Candidatus Moranbacteria bacterium]|nr:LysM domain-containing protein [Candidatus Moranbacteria bacterium]